MNIDKERELFEKWYDSTSLVMARFERRGLGYVCPAQQNAWEAWQARASMQDDVRKDAERYRWIRANPRLDICGTDEIAEFDAMIDQAIDKARE